MNVLLFKLVTSFVVVLAFPLIFLMLFSAGMSTAPSISSLQYFCALPFPLTSTVMSACLLVFKREHLKAGALIWFSITLLLSVLLVWALTDGWLMKSGF